MRAIWSGSLSFGLLNIPVNLWSASRERAMSFHLFDKKDHCPISYRKVCRLDNRPVDQKNIVKGYEYEKGQFVILEPDDFKKANVRKTGTIEVLSFTDENQIDPFYFEKPYYISPDEKSVKAYVLFRDAMLKAGKVGIGQFVLRDKEHIVVIRPQGEFLTLIQLRYADELTRPNDLKSPDAKYSERELDMAVSLVGALEEKFQPNKFKDTYTDELRRIIEAKAKGKKIVAVGREPVPSPLDTEAILKLLADSMKKAKK